MRSAADHGPGPHRHDEPGHAPRHGESGGAGTAVEQAERAVQIENLRRLRRHGVTILIGSDHADTPVPEALNLLHMGIFSNLELLKMWGETTPRPIFPARKIGRLDDGFEASFLALAADPLADFTHVQQIRMRVKAGRVLRVPD